jgi:hypothetical protein
MPIWRDGLAYLAANDGVVARMADAFADDASRELLKAVLAYRLLGPRHFRLPTNTPRYWQSYSDAGHGGSGPAHALSGRSKYRTMPAIFAAAGSRSKAGSATSSIRF